MYDIKAQQMDDCIQFHVDFITVYVFFDITVYMSLWFLTIHASPSTGIMNLPPRQGGASSSKKNRHLEDGILSTGFMMRYMGVFP